MSAMADAMEELAHEEMEGLEKLEVENAEARDAQAVLRHLHADQQHVEAMQRALCRIHNEFFACESVRLEGLLRAAAAEANRS